MNEKSIPGLIKIFLLIIVLFHLFYGFIFFKIYQEISDIDNDIYGIKQHLTGEDDDIIFD